MKINNYVPIVKCYDADGSCKEIPLNKNFYFRELSKHYPIFIIEDRDVHNEIVRIQMNQDTLCVRISFRSLSNKKGFQWSDPLCINTSGFSKEQINNALFSLVNKLTDNSVKVLRDNNNQICKILKYLV